MAFPDDPLVPEVGIYLGPDLGWVDATASDEVRQASAHTGGGVTIVRGEDGLTDRPQPSRCSLVLHSPGGKYSRRNPASPYFGLLGGNAPIRIRLPEADPGTAVALPGRTLVDSPTGPVVTCPHHSSLNVSADLDVRLWAIHHSGWRDSTAVMLAGKWDIVGNQRSWYMILNPDGRLRLIWSPDGTAQIARTSTVPVTPGPDGQLAIRVTLDVNNGSGGRTVLFYTAPTLAGPWTQLGDTYSTTSGTTSIFASTASLEVGGENGVVLPPFSGQLLGFRLHDGINGTLRTSPDFTSMEVGDRTITDAQGRTYTLGDGAEVVDRGARWYGEVPAWPPRWDVTGSDVWVPIEAAGIMERLGQGAVPVLSPLRRTLAATNPAALLPLEDGQLASRPASAVASAAAGESRATTFGHSAVGIGATTVARFADATGRIVTGVTARSSSTWSVMVLFKLASTPSAGFTPFLRMHMTGSPVVRWDVDVSDTQFRCRALDDDGTALSSQATNWGAGVSPTNWLTMTLTMSQSGGTTTWELRWWPVAAPLFYFFGGSYSGSVGRPTRVDLLGSADTSGAEWSHLAVNSSSPPLLTGEFLNAAAGYAGERAGLRMLRLCREAGVTITFSGHPYDTTPMGPQPAGALLDLLRECATADGGILQEARGLLGLSYRTRRSLYNRTPALGVSYANGMIHAPFEPTDDTDRVTNDVTVTRPGGSSARRELTEGPLSTQPAPAGVGRIPSDVPVNVARDAQLPSQAGFRLHQGTVDEARYPRIRLNLAGEAWTPELRLRAAQLDAGELAQLEDLPVWLPPGPTPVMVRGYSEVLDGNRWEITYNGSPGAAWRVFTVGDPVLGRLDTGGSSLVAGVSSSATQLLVGTDPGKRPWATSGIRPQDFPFFAQLGGEVVRVDAIGDILCDNPWMLTGSVTGWSSSNSSIAYSTAFTRAGYGSVRITPSGAATNSGVRDTQHVPVSGGALYRAALWVYSPTGYAGGIGPAIDWYDAADATISTSVLPTSTIPAGVWTSLVGEVAAPSNAAFAAVRGRQAGSPAATDIWYATAIILTPAVQPGTPQPFTATRSINGISKSHAAGSRLRLAYVAGG